MTVKNEGSNALTAAQALAFARGLHHIATQDGIDAREQALIDQFLAEAGHSDLLAQIGAAPFDAAEAAMQLGSTFMLRVFLRTAIVLVRRDGKVTDAELDALRDVEAAFGQKGLVDELLADSADMAIE